MQQPLPILIPAARPLIPVEAACVLLDMEPEAIANGCDEGALEFAWDIATPGADRREIRIWRQSIIDFSARKPRSNLSVDQVVATFIPNRVLRAPEIERMFSCHHSHISHLITAGCLVTEGPRPAHGSASDVTRIPRFSLVRFLGDRRIGAPVRSQVA